MQTTSLTGGFDFAERQDDFALSAHTMTKRPAKF